MNIEPLRGRTIITTRPDGKANALTGPLARQGARVYNLPTIAIHPVQYNRDIDYMFHHLDHYDWLLFTSPNGIESFLKLREGVGYTHNLPATLRVGVFGKKGAELLRSNGIMPGFVGTGQTSHSFFRQLREGVLSKNQNVLLALGDLADQKYEQYFKGFVRYTRFNIYYTTLPKSLDSQVSAMIVRKKYDLIVFTSPSTFNNLLHLLGNRLNPGELKAASIGATTTKAMEQKGCIPLLTAPKPNMQTLVESIVRYFEA